MVFHRPVGPGLFVLLLLGTSVFTFQGIALLGSPRPVAANLPLAAVNGPQKTLVILVQFSDKRNSTSPPQISTILTGVNDYYREDSYSTMSFQTDLAPPASPWYMMPQPMTYYGGDTTSSDSQLIHDALQAAYNAGVNLANYKFSIVVHAGDDEAMHSQTNSDIHSFTIPGYVFSPVPLTSYKISTSVVAETDPRGVFSHEAGHLLGLPDLYDLTQRTDPTNNFLGYWEIMALGEWNPNTGDLLMQPGTYPAQMSAWSKTQLGFLSDSNIATVQSGQSANITVQNLETSTSGIQAVRIPIAFNQDGTSTYYLLEMRAKIGTYDQYLPFPSTYPDAGLLVYKVNESIPNGMGSIRLIDAHPGGDLNDAPFGPCSLPCVSKNTFWDRSNFVKVVVTTTTPTAYSITVDRTSSPVLLLQVNTPSPGIQVSIDGLNVTADGSKEVRLPVRYGPHAVFIQPQIPIAFGSTPVEIGLVDTFSSWDNGGTANPRGISVTTDTTITAVYRIAAGPSALAIATVVVLAAAAAGVTLRRRRRASSSGPQAPLTTIPGSPRSPSPSVAIPKE